MEACQERNSSTVSLLALQAFFQAQEPAAHGGDDLRLAADHPATGVGLEERSAMVSGLPSGPMTYFTRGRTRSVIFTLYKRPHNAMESSLTAQLFKNWLSMALMTRQGR